ncbi:GNAT family N-acetyltransferase [Chryseobacterium sp. PMSZPI]|uniref:GNAT family N-acetyltransferase n=1 Tax=Chryseobacterium sp. PMSZPI TaxID=1033900 RepID=UPI000C33F710|nr:hypothetical protein [Chryseobacterium sp. PMSZPI]PKF75699.1 hypothetical protein CW752_02735 [Chryseobacterium sp. PMSZPI]
MKTFTTKTNQEIQIRLATLMDLESIQKLNRKWIISSLDTENKQDGFLYCEPFTPEDLANIINAQEMAVALVDEMIVGYYINDNFSCAHNQYKSVIAEFKRNNIISQHARVSNRTQIVVERDFQRLGIPKAMLEFLKPYLKPKFDHLFSIVINENPKVIAHQKAGWEVIGKDTSSYYTLYNLIKD